MNKKLITTSLNNGLCLQEDVTGAVDHAGTDQGRDLGSYQVYLSICCDQFTRRQLCGINCHEVLSDNNSDVWWKLFLAADTATQILTN